MNYFKPALWMRLTLQPPPPTVRLMPLTAFDHANIRTTNLDAMVGFYTDILGLTSGPRPEFPFPGAWMYLGDNAIVHLVGVDTDPQTGGDIGLEHIAFRATAKAAFLADLNNAKITFHVSHVPGFPIAQVNLFDPDGNHIHVDFYTSRDT